MDTSNLNIGDKVKVVSTKYFNSRVRVGDVFTVVGFLQDNENSPILQNKQFSRQYTWLPDGDVEKIKHEPYVEPEYIVKYKHRLKVLNDVLKICKEISKFAHRRIAYTSSFHSKVQSFKLEASLIQTILRQHNEMKRMFVKMRG